jgi:hypothetical protein
MASILAGYYLPQKQCREEITDLYLLRSNKSNAEEEWGSVWTEL